MNVFNEMTSHSAELKSQSYDRLTFPISVSNKNIHVIPATASRQIVNKQTPSKYYFLLMKSIT